MRHVNWRVGQLLIAATLMLSAHAATAQSFMTRVMVNRVPVQVYGTADQGFAVVAGSQLLTQTPDYVSILGIFEGGGRTYVVLSENPGGSRGDVFQAIDMSTTPYSISPVFGTGAGGVGKPEVVDGALIIVANSPDQKERFRYSFKDSKLETAKQVINLQPLGPARAPGGDLAAFVDGKSMGEIFKAQATASALRIMDPNAFQDARDVAIQDIQGGPFSESGGIATAWACESHASGDHWVSIAFDHQGHAWALLVRKSVPTYYGSPDIIVKRHLKPPG